MNTFIENYVKRRKRKLLTKYKYCYVRNEKKMFKLKMDLFSFFSVFFFEGKGSITNLFAVATSLYKVSKNDVSILCIIVFNNDSSLI